MCLLIACVPVPALYCSTLPSVFVLEQACKTDFVSFPPVTSCLDLADEGLNFDSRAGRPGHVVYIIRYIQELTMSLKGSARLA